MSSPHIVLLLQEGNILITVIRFTRYHFFLGSNNTFMTDSMYLGTFQICRNFHEHYYYLLLFSFNYIRDLTNRRKLFFVSVADYASFSHQARSLKTNLLGLTPNFSKYYLKTGTICLLFLSSHVSTALEFESNHFGILLGKKLSHVIIMKLNHQSEKYSEHINHSDIIL